MATPNPTRLIEIITDGRSDGGDLDEFPTTPQQGVIPVMAFKLCGSPVLMRVHRRKKLFLKKGTKFWRRVEQSKIRSADHGDDGLIYVVDTEGENPTRKLAELQQGRDAKRLAFPMAVGVSHPCIEAWLLADASALQQAMGLNDPPLLPTEPEDLPEAPKKTPGDFYKRYLAQLVGKDVKDLDAETKWEIAKAVKQVSIIETKCPNVASFAEEVRTHILPLFTSN